MVRPWGRRERRRVTSSLLGSALAEIRFLAGHPESAEHPDGALPQIGMIADACHNLPGAGATRPWSRDDEDPFVYLWQTLAPARRPRLRRRGVRVPRTLHEFAAVDTASLRALVLEAAAMEPPGRKPPGAMLAHLDPAGRHLVRAARPGEPLFLPPGPGDLRQFHGLLQMIDNSVVVGHLRLRSSSFAARPAGMRVTERLLLAATGPQSHERDVYLWTRDHRATCPQCPQCLASPGSAASSQTWPMQPGRDGCSVGGYSRS